MKMKNTYIVLIPTGISNARKICEQYENSQFNQVGALNIKNSLTDTCKLLYGDDFNTSIDDEGIIHEIEVETLTDFMDRCNDQELNLDEYFIGYVQGI